MFVDKLLLHRRMQSYVAEVDPIAWNSWLSESPWDQIPDSIKSSFPQAQHYGRSFQIWMVPHREYIARLRCRGRGRLDLIHRPHQVLCSVCLYFYR